MASRTKPASSEIEAFKKSIHPPGEDPYAKVCAYGRNGSGKTRLGGSAANAFLLDCGDKGDRSLKSRRDKVRVASASNWAQVGTAYWYLHSGNHPFGVVAIDTITEMQGLAMDFVLDEAEDRDPTREKSMPDKRSYGRAGQLMRGMLLAYRNLPMHVIFLAQERIIRDEDTKEIVEITVDLPAGSRGVAMGSVGVLGRLMPKEIRVKKGGKTKREWVDHLYVAPDEVTKTKDRTNLLGPSLRRPTLDKIIAAWNETQPSQEAE